MSQASVSLPPPATPPPPVPAPDLAARITEAISRFGLPETARRLGLEEGPALRLSHGLDVRKATRALAQVNAHRLADTEARPPCP